MEGEPVNHSWCVSVTSHCYGGFGWAGIEVAPSTEGRYRMSGGAGAIRRCDVKTLVPPDHTAPLSSCSGLARVVVITRVVIL